MVDRMREPTVTAPPPPPVPPGQVPRLGALVDQLTQQVPELIRSEIRLARAEVSEKGERAGVGIGMCGVAGLPGSFALAPRVATVRGGHR